MFAKRALLFVALAAWAAADAVPVPTEPAPVVPAPGDVGFSPKEEEALSKGREKFEFQAEVSRLMDIIINSLYTKKEVFLRELISNAADALDKARFLALSDDKLLGAGDARELRISVAPNKAAKTLTITDTGVGMTKADLINNLGTVARSGTAAFMEQLSGGGDLSLIGQFGVGFYSVYLVADRVRVVTKHNDDKQYVWESSAEGSYTVAEDPRGATLARGTEITLFLKDDALDYAKEDTVRDLIKKHSEFITFPIRLRTSKSEEVEVPVEEDAAAAAGGEADGAAAADADGEEVAAADGDAADGAAADAKPKTRKETVEKLAWVVVNEQKAIWSRPTAEVTDDEYRGFYKAISKDYHEPHTWMHFRGEGEVEFKAILYAPSKAAPDLYDNYYGTKSSLKLYVRKVLISDEFTELLPRYLNFVKGVVDSDDLPLNVSREQLQQAKILKVMAKKLVRKVLEMLRKLAATEKKALADAAAGEGGGAGEGDKKGAEGEDDEGGDKKAFEIPSHLKATAATAYSKFWEAFGKNIKLGVIEDASNRSKLAKLLRFKSTASNSTDGRDGAWRSLEDYVASLKEGQKQIYYLAGESVKELSTSPFLERFQARGLEVLFLTDPIDEYTVQNLPEFDGRKLQSITKEGLVLPNEGRDEKRRAEAYAADFKPLTDAMKAALGDRVEKVVVSARLASSPAVLVTSQYGNSANMERIMRAQAFADPSKAAMMKSSKTLEINPRHPIIVKLADAIAAAPEDAAARDVTFLLYDNALVNSGFAFDDATAFQGRLSRTIAAALKIESLELAPERELPPEPTAEPEAEGEEEEEGGEEEDAGAAGATAGDEL